MTARPGTGSKFVEESLRSLCERGAKLIRLDAFGYATKKVGTKCFFEVETLFPSSEIAVHFLDRPRRWG